MRLMRCLRIPRVPVRLPGPVTAGSRLCRRRALWQSRAARLEQLWGHFRNNRVVVHRNSEARALIPFHGAARAGSHPQACTRAKVLIRQCKAALSTDRGRLYYYHYGFIKEIKKKTGTTATAFAMGARVKSRPRSGRCKTGDRARAARRQLPLGAAGPRSVEERRALPSPARGGWLAKIKAGQGRQGQPGGKRRSPGGEAGSGPPTRCGGPAWSASRHALGRVRWQTLRGPCRRSISVACPGRSRWLR